MLLCTVRDCRLPLTRETSRVVCPRGHSFDVARSGYINLLQPQDRRSKHPGDSPLAIAGRRHIYDQGVAGPLVAAIRDLASPTASDVVLEAGSGDGFYLGSLTDLTGCSGHGLDISSAALDAAARRYGKCEWVAANADRFIPYADATFTLVLSITARMNAPEFRRLLRPGGRLLVAVPAPDDLIELRGRGRDHSAAAIATFAPAFSLATQLRATTTAHLDAESVAGLLHSIYRPLRAEPPQATSVTFSLDLLLFRPA